MTSALAVTVGRVSCLLEDSSVCQGTILAFSMHHCFFRFTGEVGWLRRTSSNT